MAVPRHILPVIVISQLCCTSMWFAGNAVLGDVSRAFHLPPGYLGYLTSSVQFGFISGTLVFALLAVSDRFSPSRVFFVCSLLAGLSDICMLAASNGAGLLFSRYLTGFFLAGIYPVGMKIASDYYREGLGRSLGFLVGALVAGTAFPHLLKSLALSLPWQYVVYATAALSALGGACILLFVPDGPDRGGAQKLSFGSAMKSFADKNFRAAAFGYFGHMWEVYAFWAFIPAMLTAYAARYPDAHLQVPLLSFVVIASGSVACALAGVLAQRSGAKKIATISLLLSCTCCLASPFFLFAASPAVFISCLLIWGMTAVADSPLFSALVARNGPAAARGTSLTIVTCIGFAITIVSIQLLTALAGKTDARYLYTLLAIGPLCGLYALMKKER